LTVGPFRFRVRLADLSAAGIGDNEPSLPREQDERARERELDGLRIQAAAVAAQQAALTEEEARFEQRRVALDQQEKQLAAHLEEKRRQLLQLQEQVRKARLELQQQEKTYEKRVGAVAGDLARERASLAESQRQAKKERNRLVDLRRDLKHRWHRHWLAERLKTQRLEQELASHRLALEKEAERLRAEREAFTQDRLRFNGESELGCRQLKAAWADLRRDQKHLQDQMARLDAEARGRARHADERDAKQVRAERELEDQKRQWQGTLLHLQKEADGLDSRIRNQRRKVLDQEQEAQRLEAIIRAKHEGLETSEQPAIPDREARAPCEPTLATPADSVSDAPARMLALDMQVQAPEFESALRGRLADLEQVAGELADQRMHLMEQWQRLLHVRQQWQLQHDGAANDLEALTLRLREEEKTHAARERAVIVGELHLRQRLNEVIHLRHNLEGCQARLRSRAVAWEAERDRVLAVVDGREQAAERRLSGVNALRAQWKKRRRRELERLQGALTSAVNLHGEYASLRDECLKRQAALDHKERDLAEQTLALEQFRLECTGQSEDSPAAERQLDRLRRRWASLSAGAERSVTHERQVLQVESSRTDERFRHALQLARAVEIREAKQADEKTAWEHECALLKDKSEQMRQDLHALQVQRTLYERQIEELRDEVDRVARVLLGDDEPATLPLVQAA
jgi:hypothetical protein